MAIGEKIPVHRHPFDRETGSKLSNLAIRQPEAMLSDGTAPTLQPVHYAVLNAERMAVQETQSGRMIRGAARLSFIRVRCGLPTERDVKHVLQQADTIIARRLMAGKAPGWSY